jgi:hypothetical protein
VKEHSNDALVLEAHNQSGGARDLSLIPFILMAFYPNWYNAFSKPFLTPDTQIPTTHSTRLIELHRMVGLLRLRRGSKFGVQRGFFDFLRKACMYHIVRCAAAC